MRLRPARIRPLVVSAALGVVAAAHAPVGRRRRLDTRAHSAKLSAASTPTIACAPDDRDSSTPLDDVGLVAVGDCCRVLLAPGRVLALTSRLASASAGVARPLEVAPKTSPPACAGLRIGAAA